jgi:DNA-binding XRE family transcriptional regulator
MPKIKPVPVFDFISLRKKLGFNQAEMANRMGLGSRAYFKLEQEPDSINVRHIMLARMVSLQEAVMNRDKSLAEKVIGDLATAYSQLPPTAWVVFHGRGRFMRAASSPSNGGQTMDIFQTEVEAKAAAKRWLKNGESVSAGTLIGNTTGRAIHPQEIETWLKAD